MHERPHVGLNVVVDEVEFHRDKAPLGHQYGW